MFPNLETFNIFDILIQDVWQLIKIRRIHFQR